MNKFRINFKIWLEAEDNKGILGEGKCNLLKTIKETGSIIDAIKKENLTYRKTWDNLNDIEQTLDFPIIQRQRGGKDGGQTVLTSQGIAIIEAFEEFHQKHDVYIQSALNEMYSNLMKRIEESNL